MQFNSKNFSVEEVIKKRVNLEAEVEYANQERPVLPKFKNIPKSKKSVGLWNFIQQLKP